MSGDPGASAAFGASAQLTLDSVKMAADANGIVLADDGAAAARELAEQATFRIRTLLQTAQKYAMHAKRQKLNAEDLDLALKAQGQEPLYGLCASEHIPFRFASGGGRELHFLDDKELDLNDLVKNQPMPKIPMAPSLRAHWLAIDGVQPSIPENPPASSKDQMLMDSTNPLGKLTKKDAMDNKLGTLLQTAQKPFHAAPRLKTTETVNVKQLAKHELSVEQQLYYKEITEACVGSDESRRAEALTSLQVDPGLHQMLPRLCTFIAEGVRVNVVQHNLAILIYLMRMVKSLLENQTLFLEKYLHELIPAVTTCIVARQLCARPDVDNHWALRDFASRLINSICKNFNTSTNNIQTRVTRMFAEALRNDGPAGGSSTGGGPRGSSQASPLVSYYGAIAGLQELGPEVIKVLIIPHIKYISARIDQASEGGNLAGTTNVDKVVTNIRNLVVKGVTPVLKVTRPLPDILDEYKADFGSIGEFLYRSVSRNRGAMSAAAGGAQMAARAAVAAGAGPRPAMHAVQGGAAAAAVAGQQRVYVMQQGGATGVPPNQGAVAAGQVQVVHQQPGATQQQQQQRIMLQQQPP